MNAGDESEQLISEGPSPVKLVLLAVVGLLSVIFVFSNADSTEVKFFGWSFELPLFLVLLMVLVAGALLGQAAMWWLRRSRRDG